MALTGSAQAYKQARAGIARAGATRANYFLYNLVIDLTRVVSSIGGIFTYETVILTQYIEAGSLTVNEALNDELDTATFTLVAGCPFIPQAGQQIRIGLGTTANALFAGQVMTVTTRYHGGIAQPWMDVSCVDHLAMFDSRLVTYEWTNLPGKTIIEDLVARFTTGDVSTAGVASDLPTLTIVAVNLRPSTILRTITNAAGGGFYISAVRILHAFGSAGPLGGLTNPQPLTWPLWSLKQFSGTEDGTQVRTKVIVEGQRTTMRATNDFGTVPVIDNSMFEPTATPRPVRVGTKLGSYTRAPRLPAVRGTTVRVAANPGDFVLQVVDTSFMSGEIEGAIEVGNQVLPFSAVTGGATPSFGLTYAVQAPLSVGTEVTLVPTLVGVGLSSLETWPQPVDTPVVLMAYKAEGVLDWAIRTASGQPGTRANDGVVEHLIQDGRFGLKTATDRVQAELNDFKTPLRSIQWETEDLNAEVGRLQSVNMPASGYTALVLQITDVALRWPLWNRPPRRTCHAAQTRRAALLDFIVTDQR